MAKQVPPTHPTSPKTLRHALNAQPEALRIQRVKDWFVRSGYPAFLDDKSHAYLLEMAERFENSGYGPPRQQYRWSANPFGPIFDRRTIRLP